MCSFALSSYQRLTSCSDTWSYTFDCRYFIHMCGFPPSTHTPWFFPSLCLTLLTLYPSFIQTDVSVPSLLPTCMVLFCHVPSVKTQCHLIYQHFSHFRHFAKSYDFVSSCLCSSPPTVLPVTPISDDCVKFTVNNRRKLGQHVSQSGRGACS